MEYLPLFVAVLLALASAWLVLRRRGRTKPKPLSLVLPAQFIVADIETTGLDPLKHEIIEIAAIRVNRDSSLHDAFTGLVKPKRKISAKITSITGITNDLLDREARSSELQLGQTVQDGKLPDGWSASGAEGLRAHDAGICRRRFGARASGVSIGDSYRQGGRSVRSHLSGPTTTAVEHG